MSTQLAVPVYKTLRHLEPYSNQIGYVGLNSFSAVAETVCKRSQLNILSLPLDIKISTSCSHSDSHVAVAAHKWIHGIIA
ncbi:hypothetical protein MTR_1178s0010 [Medicago truncatula]|uniref:Uncharacterized protein n=1 Tax=Medicago truncatula TaxID=3880 RepID=A0A072TEH0_MEDTR|nr:hypothetical protein MTR_1178s0010 [Medicago truncatula]